MSAGVALLEDNIDLRMLLELLLKTQFDLPCLTYASVDDLIAHKDDVLKTDVIFLDVNLGVGAPSGVDALHWLREHSYLGKIFFLSGHARGNPLLFGAEYADIPILEKPVPAKDLERIIMQSLSIKGGSDET